jgi:excisionase family DNA binding protein
MTTITQLTTTTRQRVALANDMRETQPAYFSVSGAAQYGSVSRDFIYDLIKDGTLKAKKVRGVLRISRANLDRVFGGGA